MLIDFSNHLTMPNDKNELLSLIKEFNDFADFESALQILMDALELNPTDAQLHLLRAEVLLKMDFRDEAIRDCQFTITSLASRQNSFADDISEILLEIYLEIKRAARENADVCLLIAEIYFEYGNIRSAETVLYDILAEDLTNRSAAKLLEEIVTMKAQEILETDADLLTTFDEKCLESLATTPNKEKFFERYLLMTEKELKCCRTIAILAKFVQDQQLNSQANFYLLIGKVSYYLNDYKFAKSSLYLANFYIETQEKANWEVSIQIDARKRLALCEYISESNDGHMVRAFKIMTSALIIAIPAVDSSTGQDFLKEVGIMEWPFAKSFNYPYARWLNWYVIPVDKLLPDFDVDKLLPYFDEAYDFLKPIAEAVERELNPQYSLESNDTLANITILKQVDQLFRPSESSGCGSNILINFDKIMGMQSLLGKIFQSLELGPLKPLYQLLQLILRFPRVQLSIREYNELIFEKAKPLISELANNLLEEKTIISKFCKFFCAVLDIDDIEINIPKKSDRIDTLIERTNLSKNPIDVFLLIILYAAKYQVTTFIESIKIKEIMLDGISHIWISLQNCFGNRNAIKLDITNQPIEILQMYLAIFQTDKALLVAEKYRMRSFVLLHFIPNSISESPNSTIQGMQNYCSNKSTAILYIADSGVNDCDCWLLLPDIIDLLYFSLSKHKDLSSRPCLASCSDFYNGLKSQIDLEAAHSSLLEARALTFYRTFNIFNCRNNMSQQSNISILMFNLWQATSYHLSMSGAKRLVVIPQLRFYNIPFCLLGYNLESCSEINKMPLKRQQSLVDYPLLKKFILSISPAYGVLSADLNEFKTYDDCKASAIIIANPEKNLDKAENEESIVFEQLNKLKIYKNKVTSMKNNESSINTILNSLTYHTIVHFAAHASLVHEDNNILSGAIRVCDGFIHADDIQVQTYNTYHTRTVMKFR